MALLIELSLVCSFPTRLLLTHLFQPFANHSLCAHFLFVYLRNFDCLHCNVYVYCLVCNMRQPRVAVMPPLFFLLFNGCLPSRASTMVEGIKTYHSMIMCWIIVHNFTCVVQCSLLVLFLLHVHAFPPRNFVLSLDTNGDTYHYWGSILKQFILATLSLLRDFTRLVDGLSQLSSTLPCPAAISRNWQFHQKWLSQNATPSSL